MFSKRFLGVGLGATVVLSAASSAAVSFDAQGDAQLDSGALFSTSFETELDAGDPDASPSFSVEEDPGALHGSHVARIPSYQNAGFDLPLPAASTRVGATLWARGEVFAVIELTVAGRSENFGSFYPTGRMTSDGWYELAMHGLSVDIDRVEAMSLGLFAPNGADVDVLEVVNEGDPVPAAACNGASDKSSCGPSQICMWGRCIDFQSRVPPLPPDDYRQDLVDYLDQRFALLFGPFENRTLDLPNARLEIDAMRSAGDAWSFWRHFRVAIHRLHDWHTRGSDVSGYIIQNPRPISVCFIEGKADLTEQVAPSTSGNLDVLVSHVGTANTLDLHAGDRLVSVDGQHPIPWARSLISVDFDYDTASNHVTQADPVSRLNRLIAAFADHIEVVRCDAASGKCASKTEVISISSLPPLPPGTPSGGVGCDNRPQIHVPGTGLENHPLGGFYSGIVKESNDTEKIYGLQWSSLYVTGSSGGVGPALEGAVAEWRANARGVILDHRTGYGGTTAGPPIIWNLVREPTPLDFFEFRQSSDQKPPASIAAGKALFEQLAAAGTAEIAGSSNPDLSLPVALLIHLDGSASDWLPLGIKGAPKAKIFGPYETAGAFSTLFSFGYWFGIGYSIAVGDTLHSSGQMLNGHGVQPDVVVLPLESDLLAGKDTVYDAALAWVRQELKP